MFSIPKHGWVNINISTWSDRASYLSDLPCDFLDAIIEKLNNWNPSCVKVDAEGWEYIIMFDDYYVHIIEYKETIEHYFFEISAKELAKEIYKDISENLYEWSLWNYFSDNEHVRNEYEQKLLEKLNMLKSLLN